MSHYSDLSRDRIIDDNTDLASLLDGQLRGARQRFYGDDPAGYLPCAWEFSLPLIDESEWPERIEELERTRSRITDLCGQAGLPPLHQGRTNYCWANCIVDCVQILRVRQCESLVPLSPASVGGPLTHYRNVGGWPAKALEYVSAQGIAPVSLWGANSIDSRHDTPQVQAERLKYRVSEWWDCHPRNFREAMTCALLRIPTALTFNYMRHAVTGADPVRTADGRYGLRVRNSGYGRDASGHTVLLGERAIPDECLAPRVTTAS